MEENNNDLHQAKKHSSRLGWSLFVLVTATTFFQFLMAFVFEILRHTVPALADATLPMWLMTLIPVYLMAMPLALLVLKAVPVAPILPAPLGAKRFLVLAMMCFPIMYGGNLLGNLLAALFSGGNAQNALVDFVIESPVHTFLVAVIAAPLAEEFFFRKCILDRFAAYGEVTAVLLSGFAFGMFHMNLFQFFYAFGLGILFAYIYLRTGLLRYPVLLHMLINFLGSVLAPWLVTNLDPALLSGEITDLTVLMEQLPAFVLYMLYSGLLLMASAGGLALLIKRWKKRQFFPASQELPAGSRSRTVLCRPGMILFLLFCVIFTIMNLFIV